jgi:Tol biopolymer transport system component
VKPAGAVEMAVSDNGTLIYKGGSSTSVALVSLDSAGREDWRVALPPLIAPVISPDGRRVAFTSNTSQSQHDVWLHDLTLGTTSRVTANGRVAAWLDSRRLVYHDVLPGGNLLVVEEAEARTSVRGIANWSPLRRR